MIPQGHYILAKVKALVDFLMETVASEGVTL